MKKNRKTMHLMKKFEGVSTTNGGLMTNRSIIFILALCFGAFAQAIDLTGEVMSAIDGGPLQGVIVTLKNNPQLSDTTKADGTYQLLGTVGVIRSLSGEASFSGCRLNNGLLEIGISKSEPVTVETYSLNGVLKERLVNCNSMPGIYKYDLNVLFANAKMSLIKVRQGDKTTVFSFLSMRSSFANNMSMDKRVGSLSKVASFNDTIICTLNGFTTAKAAVSASTGVNNITLQPFNPYIVAVSISYDYTAGNMGSYRVSDTTAFTNQLSIWDDNDIRTYNGAIYVIERQGKDNLLKINGSVISASSVTYEKNIGASVNIQDIAFINSTKAYVTQYGSSKIAIVDPSTGLTSSKTIDLSAFDTYAGTDSADKVPYMSRELYCNGKVYVACQRLHAPVGGYIQAADTSKIVVINATTDSVEKSISLLYKNPQELSICNGKLYVASVGIWGMSDAGVEEIDLLTDTNVGSVVTESAFSGDIASIIVVSNTKGYAVISNLTTYTPSLYSFNPQAKTVGTQIAGVDAPCSNHMAFDGTYVYVGDRSSTTPGIVIINPATDAKVGATKNVGLPPNSLAFLTVN